MFDNVQLWALGAAAVLDTALLLALWEQRNRPFARTPILAMLGGAWLWHSGAFFLLVLRPLPAVWGGGLSWGCLLAMAAGMLLMPSGLLHMIVRLWRNGLEVRSALDPRHALLYLPLLALIPIALWVQPAGGGHFLTPLLPLAWPYLVWTSLVCLLAGVALLHMRRRVNLPGARPFFFWIALVLFAWTAFKLFVFLYARDAWPHWEDVLLFIGGLSPSILALLFAYYVIRFNFLHLVLERTVVYGAIVVGVVLFHQLAFQELTVALPGHYRVPLVILEALVVGVLIMLYQPLRQRLGEATRYLMGVRVAEIRERLGRLAIDLSRQGQRAPQDLLDWFGRALREALDVEFVAGWIARPTGEIVIRFRDGSGGPGDEQAGALVRQLKSSGSGLWSRRSNGNPATSGWGPPYVLHDSGASLAVLKTYQSVTGLLLVGRHRGNQELGDEEANAVLFLVEELAITVENNLLVADRLAAERRALQNEKLTALGLLASSIAHEVKNPLSAIKTIATVLAEDLGPNSPHAEDVGLILGEVDRLAATTNQLLEFARPKASSASPASVARVLTGTLQVLGHLARQQDITIETSVSPDLPAVSADENALREIFFNLLSNSLQAAGAGGRVAVACQSVNGCVLTAVRDSGPGIPLELRESLFEPFATSKPDGTGLGLYVAARRVRELGGEIHCESGPDGTSFHVKLPAKP